MHATQRTLRLMLLAAAAIVSGSVTALPIHRTPASDAPAPAGGDERLIDEDEFLESTADALAAVNDWTLEQQPGRPAATVSALRAPQIGSGDNAFSNTCDGRVIGFVGPAGDRPRMDFRGTPAGATFQCRTGPAGSIAKQPFRACDDGDGTKPFHVPPLAGEGSYRTEVRYTVRNQTSDAAIVTYYAHHSLDRVSCCRTPVPDADFFATARAAIPSTQTFADVRLDNPFIEIPRPALTNKIGYRNTTRVLSLRRTFLLSADRRFLLIRRTMPSRRTRERTGQDSCVGLRISEPIRSTAAAKPLACRSSLPRQTEYLGGLVPSRCPDVYCTVTTCQIMADGCERTTHTFNRGPNQKPWVVTNTICPEPVVTSFVSHECDSYVLNANGQAACLAVVNGKPQVRKAFTDAQGTGLKILSAQRPVNASGKKLGDRYVFSAKSRKAGIRNALFLPE